MERRQPDLNSELYVQFGCGLSAPDFWRNFDASPTLRLQRHPILRIVGHRLEPRFPRNVEYGDVTKGLPISDASAAAVYSSHVLEHLALEDARVAICETYRILKPGGVFRLVVPDLEYIANVYRNSSTPDAAIQFMRNTILGQERRPKGALERIRDAFGNSQHRWMWDYRSLANELGGAGFVRIRRASIGDSDLVAFAGVEDADRWNNALGIECHKNQH